LHPRYKTLYFQCQKWPESWIDTAMSLVREQWEKHYRPQGGTRDPLKEPLCSSYFADLDTFSASEGVDELDEYLGLPAQPSIADPLMHWETQRQGGSYLAKMALDFLSVPG
ncbi:hypothetical protein K439DRAFT_1308281, partial [Ramaria rubella]